MNMQANPASAMAAQGQQAMQGGLYEQAAQYFAQAIQYAPNVDGLHYHFASACVWRGRPQEALMSLQRCMSLRGPWYNHAMQLQSQISGQMGMQMQPMGGAPMGQMPMAGQMPMGQMPMGQMPMAAAQMPMGQMPMGQMPMGQMPTAAAQMPQQPAPAPKEEKKKKKGIGWGVAALGIVGAVAIGGAIGTGALDGVADSIF